MNSMKLNLLTRAILYPIWALVVYGLNYMFVPAWNIQSGGFRVFLILAVTLLLLVEMVITALLQDKVNDSLAKWTPFVLFFLFFIVVFPAIQFFNSTIFRATDYANLIEIEERDFHEDFPEIDQKEIPMMDRDTAKRLGDRQIGGMSDLVSQFVPANDYTQINIDNHPYRVTPLEYASFMRWRSNRHDGIPSYLKVDMVTGEVEVENLEESMKYSHSERFGRNVHRHLRRQYPTVIFQNPSFEVDDSGHPRYIATTYSPKFFWGQQEPDGLIVLDAVTGNTEKYELEDMPEWADRVYSSSLIMDQLEYNGKYRDGFMNNLFEKRGVTRPTNGYNYIPMNDDVYLYTGVTSVNRDSSNIGFHLVNLRTKEAAFYPVTSADERSAMSSAEGVVQERGFKATFPLLINLDGNPYFILSLKDDSGLVRLHALIDAQNYQDVIVDQTVEGLITQLNGGISVDVKEVDEDLEIVTGEVENIQHAVVSGDTIYYFMIDGSIYKANINLHDSLPFLSEGQLVEGVVNGDQEFRTIEVE